MAFVNANWQPSVSQRGGPALSFYYHESDNLTTIKGANYFNDNDVRSFIRQQRNRRNASGNPVNAAELGRSGIPVLIQSAAASGGGQEIVSLVMDESNGNVTSIRTGPLAA